MLAVHKQNVSFFSFFSFFFCFFFSLFQITYSNHTRTLCIRLYNCHRLQLQQPRPLLQQRLATHYQMRSNISRLIFAVVVVVVVLIVVVLPLLNQRINAPCNRTINAPSPTTTTTTPPTPPTTRRMLALSNNRQQSPSFKMMLMVT